jgi:hypothetical protein
MAMTRGQAAGAVAEATAERNSIQTNLLDLDGSFVKRMIAGATLTGESELRWEVAAADLAVLWEIFNACAAAVDEAAELMAGAVRGLLDAYQAKAARLGAAEDTELAMCNQQAHDLLWTAPCDLAAEATAVTHYQEAILTLSGGRRPQ